MKKLFGLVLALALFVTSFNLSAFAVFAAEDEGIRFEADTVYKMSGNFTETPRTIETWIKIDSDAVGALGKIACCQGTGKDDNFCLRISASGNNSYIQFFWRDTSGSNTHFDKHPLPKGEKVHIAVTTTTTEVSLYINGVLKETKSAKVIDVHDNSLAIGGSYQPGNTNYLKKTEMYSFAMYSDARTAEEIKADMKAPSLNDQNLLVSYDFSAKGVERLKDSSKNKNHLDCCVTDEFFYKSEYYPGNQLASEGFSFNWVDSYSNTSALSAAPRTMEVSVCLREKSSTNLPRWIFNNGTTSLQLYHMQADGYMGLRYKDPSGQYDFRPDKLATGDWVHIAIVRDQSNVICYVNGELVDKVAQKSSSMPSKEAYYLGCDPNAKNSNAFYDGKIGYVAFYSDARTAAEVAKDASAKNPDKDNLLFAYDLKSVKQEEVFEKVEDLSNSNNDLKVNRKWTNATLTKDNYAYSFAVVGDPQIVTYNDPDLMVDMYRWIAENKDSKKIKYVINLGDNTEKDNQTKEWDKVMEGFRVLDKANIPYIINRGNHDDDYRFNWNLVGNNRWNAGPLNAGCNYKNLIGNNYQYVDDYGPATGHTTGGFPCYENAWYELKVGDVDYLIFALDYGARDDSLNWAGEIIKAHPYHNVIITTHNYLNQDGTLTYNNGANDRSKTTTGEFVGTLPSIQNKAGYDADPVEGSRVTADGLDYNDGREIWQKLVSKHDNIVMVLSGHVATNGDDSLVKNARTRANGTTVVEMMVNPQGIDAEVALTGMVAMLYFSEDGSKMQVEWYSTAKDAYYDAAVNQFSETVPVKVYSQVKFDSKGGSAVAAQTVQKGGKATKPANPTRTGYTFKGWTLNGSAYNFNTAVKGDITLVASWEKNVENYTVTFNANGGSGTMAKVTKPAGEYTLPQNGFNAPEGKRFKAWKVGGVEKAAGEKITLSGNITVTAIWENIPAQHVCDIKAVAKLEPSCTENGKMAYYKCDGCSKFFEDAQGKKQIKDLGAWGNIPKLGHSSSQWSFDGESHWKECGRNNCGAVIDGSLASHKDGDKNGSCDTCQYTVGAVSTQAKPSATSSAVVSSKPAETSTSKPAQTSSAAATSTVANTSAASTSSKPTPVSSAAASISSSWNDQPKDEGGANVLLIVIGAVVLAGLGVAGAIFINKKRSAKK